VAERTADLEKSNELLTVELDEREEAQARLTRAVRELERHRHDSELLSEMNDRLQVCRDVSEVAPVLGLYGAKLFPKSAGSVHLLNEDRSRMVPLVQWGTDAEPCGLEQDDCWALRRGQTHVVTGPGDELVCAHVETLPEGGYLCLPMVAQGNLSGLLHVRFLVAPEVGKPTSLEQLEPVARSAAERTAVAVASLQLRARLREQSVHDPLTGLHNRRYMEESLAREIPRAQRNDASLAVAMLDLDHFKVFNDTYGHDAGDALLRELGDLLRRSVRAEDVACRFGGEEFTLIMPSMDAESALRRGEQICERVRSLQVDYQGQRIGDVTISIGIAILPEHGQTADDLIRAADAALYDAKSAGRDRVEICSRAAERTPGPVEAKGVGGPPPAGAAPG
jgi:diguanylate cyclase (GGDEF)-like protein